MPTKLLAAAVAQMADTVGRIGESAARIDANQINSLAQLVRIQQSLHEQVGALARIEERQFGFQNTGAQLTRIEQSTDHVRSALLALISEHGVTTGKVESILLRTGDKTSSIVRVLEKTVEWAPKVLANWAPISAAIVAAYKLGVPWLRQFLGF